MSYKKDKWKGNQARPTGQEAFVKKSFYIYHCEDLRFTLNERSEWEKYSLHTFPTLESAKDAIAKLKAPRFAAIKEL